MVRFSRLSALGLLALGSVFLLRANASTFSTSGNFAADNSSYELMFAVTGPTDFTAATTSYASGGFLTVLTLFNGTSGNEIDNAGSGTVLGDASLSDVLGAGTYDLFLTEFPNVAVGNLSAGFLFAGDPTATGDLCGVSGGMFLNTITCTSTTNAYALTTTTNAASSVTPEPPSALLLLLPLAGVVVLNRRKLASSATL